MKILTLQGSHREIGRAFGEACRDEIQEFYHLRVKNALMQAKQHGDRDVDERHLLEVARRSLGPTEAFDPDGFAELEGIAEGSGLSLEAVLGMNGLTDYRDVLAWHGDLEDFGGCSAFIVGREVTAGGDALCGQTWDLATDNMPYVIGVIRKPDHGPETRCLTTVGCLSLIGMNELGLAVGTTNIRTEDARPGVNYLSLIHRALASATLEEAVSSILSAQRAGAHFYYLVDAEGRAAAVETTAHLFHRQEASTGQYVHCNHCLIPAHVEIEGNTPSVSSHARQHRLVELIEADGGKSSLETMKRALADHENGDNAICRHDFGGISSNGAVVMAPTSRRIEACHGLPCQATWADLSFAPPS